MGWKITNKSRQLLVVPLNSGTAVNLAPGESSAPLDEVEIKANSRIEKMSEAGLISLAGPKKRTDDDDDDSPAGRARAKKTKS